MIDINLIREKPDWVKQQLLKRMDSVDFTEVLKIDAHRRELMQSNEARRSQRNANSDAIAKLKREKKDAAKQIAEMRLIGDKIARCDKEIAITEQKIFDIISALPNIPLPEVVAGGKENNRVYSTFGKKPNFTFKPAAHVELATALGLIDYERAAKISGAKTWVYTGAGAMLEWALLNYFIDFHIANGYKFIMPPHLLNWESGYSAGQFPKFIDDIFVTDFNKDPKKSKFLLPTAETALLNLHRDEIIKPEELPIKYFGYSPCYRKEAGSYRTGERGMIRGFQFNKIEMFIYCLPEQGPKYFDELLRNAQKLVEGLGLHFQTVALAAEDCSAAMAKTHDIEVYIPSMQSGGTADAGENQASGYKEVSSVSTATDFQTRRANIRTKDASGKSILLHTLNASGLATSRLIPAILEQFQNEDGSVNIPTALHKYMHGITVIQPKNGNIKVFGAERRTHKEGK
jgi:seryl-tRNA synthetase